MSARPPYIPRFIVAIVISAVKRVARRTITEGVPYIISERLISVSPCHTNLDATTTVVFVT
jgi:hypothetical protein